MVQRERRASFARPHTPDELARDYVTLLRGGTRAPTTELAKIRAVPVETMRSHIHLVRANGFLTETSRGRAAGELTAEARRPNSNDALRRRAWMLPSL
jgi:hypothetical protein